MILCLASCRIVQAQGPNPDAIYVQSITYGGNGCPQGSVAQSLSPPRAIYVTGFDDWIVSAGPDVPITENRKNCQINVNLHIPAHAAAAVVTMFTRGFVNLPRGVVATVGSIAYFGGDIVASDSPTNFVGPVRKNYESRISFTINPPASSAPAVIPINLNAQVRITGPATAPALITVDYQSAQITQE